MRVRPTSIYLLCASHSKHLFTACVTLAFGVALFRARRFHPSTLPPLVWRRGLGGSDRWTDRWVGLAKSQRPLPQKYFLLPPPLSLALSLSSRIHKNRWGSTQEYIRIKDGLPLYSLSLQEYIRIDGGVTSESKMVSLSLQEYIRIDEEGALNNTSESKMVSLSLQEYIRIDGGTWGASGSKRSLRCRSVGGEEKKRNLSQQLPRLCQTGPSVCPSVGGVRREKISASSCHGFARSAHLSVHLSETQ